MSWRDEALCAQVDGDIFFPTIGGDNGKAAKQICARCPVAAKCLAEAMTADDGYGVRGGLTVKERQRLRRVA